MDAPSVVDENQLVELGISSKKSQAGGEGVYSQIVATLTNAHIPYESYEHESVRTSQEASQVRATALHLGIKALVMYADDAPVMVGVGADRKVDMKAFKHAFGVKDLRMATPEEVEKVTSVTIGAVPPFGHIFGIPLYMDEAIRNNKTVVFNAGLHTKSISLKQGDYEKVSKPIVGNYSKEA
jgi:Ala-tRNA(Pro) deacylase